MPFEYISPENAIERDGLRMVVVGNIPSPWSEAAKGIFHIEGIEWSAVRLVFDSPALKDWIGTLSGPVVIYNDEKPRDGWAEILLLADQLSSSNQVIPGDPTERAFMFGLAHELMGEGGLAWSRRLQNIKTSFEGGGGFHIKVAKYLGRRYGYDEKAGAQATRRTVSLLNMFANRLTEQKNNGSQFYIGNTPTAVDIYSAASMALFAPLPEEQCKMEAYAREAFEIMDEATREALHPILLEHRDMMYSKYLELPLSL